MIGGGTGVGDGSVADAVLPICSRSECRSDAAWNVNWRNPRIHGPERVKVWLACDEHREYLYDYLSSRDFPVVIRRIDEPLYRLGDNAGNGSAALSGRHE